MKITTLLLFIVSSILVSCSDTQQYSMDITNYESRVSMNYIALLEELSDEQYPDNPDISIRHEKCVSTTMNSIEFEQVDFQTFNIKIIPDSKDDDTLIMKKISLTEFIPTIPSCVKGNDYMSLISVVNQEWNRNQVKWVNEDLDAVLGENKTINGEVISRIDVARNCLSSYLWELFFYTKVDGKDKVYYHGWFDFPQGLYIHLFEESNDDKFDKYAKYMENWKDPVNENIDLELIRQIEYAQIVPFTIHNTEMYPLKGERKKKEIAIIYPTKYSKMSDFHTDSAQFATFSQPGFYNRKDPRTTELGRFFSLLEVEYRSTLAHGQHLDELNFVFKRTNGEITQFNFGGLDFQKLPQLSVNECNSGHPFSMGIGNHPFYEDCVNHNKLCSKDNPYFGVLMTKEGEWLDSHKIGIDGPLLHLDINNPNILHVWLLSFERHALVGHYEIDLRSVSSHPIAQLP